MKKNKFYPGSVWKTVAAILFVAAILMAILGLWWWAILGWSKNVGIAHFVTAAILGASGIAASGCSNHNKRQAEKDTPRMTNYEFIQLKDTMSQLTREVGRLKALPVASEDSKFR